MVEPSFELIQAMLQKVLDGQREHSNDFREVKLRLGELQSSVAGLRRDQALDAEVSAHPQAQFDRLREEVDRIKRRLDLADA